MVFLEHYPMIFVYGSITLIALFFLALSFIFEKKTKISEFFERVAEWIKDFFT